MVKLGALLSPAPACWRTWPLPVDRHAEVQDLASSYGAGRAGLSTRPCTSDEIIRLPTLVERALHHVEVECAHAMRDVEEDAAGTPRGPREGSPRSGPAGVGAGPVAGVRMSPGRVAARRPRHRSVGAADMGHQRSPGVPPASSARSSAPMPSAPRRRPRQCVPSRRRACRGSSRSWRRTARPAQVRLRRLADEQSVVEGEDAGEGDVQKARIR